MRIGKVYNKETKMKIFELRPKQDLDKNDNPWEPWYDKCFGFIVRAETEVKARKYAAKNAGDEDKSEYVDGKYIRINHVWLEEKYSTCVELNSEGDAGIIMIDFSGT